MYLRLQKTLPTGLSPFRCQIRYHSLLVPFTQFQPLSPERFSPKSAYLVTAFSRFIFGAAVY
ncbi:hypothetical protein ACE6ED_16075 [Paenibacillus sp. CN-4]|uniref:hypothetical protein n=1 Tax=Paenibacillus nanchangensis TaxID=3348343 RepID=UPI00397AA1B0